MNTIETIVTVTLNPAIDRIIEVAGFRMGGHLEGRTVARVAAGKGVNVSRTLSTLGVPTIATGFVGHGQLEMYEESLRESLIEPRFLAVDGDTRENITVVDPVSGAETHVRDVGVTLAKGDLDRMHRELESLAGPGSLIVFSGSLPPGADVGYVVGLVEVALTGGAEVAVDGPGELLRALCDRNLWLIKPNTEELAVMCPFGDNSLTNPNGDSDDRPYRLGGMRGSGGKRVTAPDDGSDDLHYAPNDRLLSDDESVRLGCELSERIRVVIVTQGAGGGYLFRAGSGLRGQVKLDARRVRSTVGCGDCLLGAFIAAQRRGDDLQTSYRFALAVATAAALHQLPGHFDHAEVNRLLANTTVEGVATG